MYLDTHCFFRYSSAYALPPSTAIPLLPKQYMQRSGNRVGLKSEMQKWIQVAAAFSVSCVIVLSPLVSNRPFSLNLLLLLCLLTSLLLVTPECPPLIFAPDGVLSFLFLFMCPNNDCVPVLCFLSLFPHVCSPFPPFPPLYVLFPFKFIRKLLTQPSGPSACLICMCWFHTCVWIRSVFCSKVPPPRLASLFTKISSPSLPGRPVLYVFCPHQILLQAK